MHVAATNVASTPFSLCIDPMFAAKDSGPKPATTTPTADTSKNRKIVQQSFNYNLPVVVITLILD
jgi:hypothetical protein